MQLGLLRPDPCSREDPMDLGNIRPMQTLQCMENVSKKEVLGPA